MSGLVDIIDLHDFPSVTLNYFSTNSERLHLFCQNNNIQPGESVLIVGRSGRVRELEHTTSGWCEVTLIEFNPLLSVQIQVYAHKEKALQKNRHRVAELRKELEDRLERQQERARKRAERAAEERKAKRRAARAA